MSRRVSAKPTGIQMFPFLAVLICTMGALVVLLHAFASHGQAKAVKLAEAQARERKETEALDVDFHKWRVGHLREAREKTQAQLAEERLKLSHVEDHQRRLQEKLDELRIAAAELERAGAEKTEEKERNAAELAETKSKLAEAKDAVSKARQDSKHKAVNYSVVPFEGRHSTSRRPIYIECRNSKIVLQPEGIELNPRDFIGFFGPGNPLASALRAQREHFARQAPAGVLAEEPYPLLLVRPDGIEAYYAARAALDSWGSDFGYELVGADWDLKFPDRDARLAELIERVVAEARERHREYVLSSSQIARRRSRPVYHAKSHGGFAQEPGTGGGPQGSGLGEWDDYTNDERGLGDESGLGDGRGAGGASQRGGQYSDQPNGALPGSLDEYAQFGNVSPADPYAEPGGFAPHPSGNSEGPGQGQSVTRGQTIDGSQFAEMGRGVPGGGPSSAYRSGADQGAADHSGEHPSGEHPGGEHPGGEHPGGEHPGGANPSGSERSSAKGGQNGPSGQANGGKAHSGTAAPMNTSPQQCELPAHNGLASEAGNPEMRNPNSPGGEGGESSGEQTVVGLPEAAYHNTPESLNIGASPTPYTLGKGKKMPASMAGVRGQDWGLMGTGVGAVDATRPILIHCFPDRLVVIPESRGQPPKPIQLGERTQDSMDELISAVWDNVKVWGKAGRGLYWRPSLVLDVRPGGDQRFDEIKSLLADSGLDVSRRRRPATATAPKPAAAPQPAVQPIRK